MAPFIDHTLLKADCTTADVERLCREAIAYRFCAVCVHPVFLPVIVPLLRDTPVKAATVIGFPLGANTTPVKRFEAEQCVAHGAAELDMVISVWALKSGLHSRVQEDIAAVVDAAGSRACVKVIIETSLLSHEEKVAACRLAVEAGAAFVKTSTGLAGGGATEDDVRLMRATVGPAVGVKASGGIRTLKDALAMLAAGANRIGTSSGAMMVTEP